MAKRGVKDVPATVADPQLLAKWEAGLTGDVSEEAARAPRASSNWISIRGRQFTMGGVVLKAPLHVVIADYVYVNSYYTGDYDPDNPTTPVCWAIGPKEPELAPGEVPDKQAESCKVCEWNRFGSGGGRRKACKNGMRLALVSSDAGEAVDESSIMASRALIAAPPTSIQPFGSFIRDVMQNLRVPLWAVTLDLDFDPKITTYGVLAFNNPKIIDPRDQANLVQAIVTYREGTARADISQDFSLISEEREPSRSTEPARRKVVRDGGKNSGVPQRKKFAR